jgi:hypothetical protein
MATQCLDFLATAGKETTSGGCRAIGRVPSAATTTSSGVATAKGRFAIVFLATRSLNGATGIACADCTTLQAVTCATAVFVAGPAVLQSSFQGSTNCPNVSKVSEEFHFFALLVHPSPRPPTLPAAATSEVQTELFTPSTSLVPRTVRFLAAFFVTCAKIVPSRAFPLNQRWGTPMNVARA